MFFSNVSALSMPSAPRRDGAGGAEERAGLHLPAAAGAEEYWGSPGLSGDQVSPGGAQAGDRKDPGQEMPG